MRLELFMTIYVGISFPWMSSWALVGMYAKCGNFDSARKSLIECKKRMLFHGVPMESSLFPMMLGSGIFSNRITFVSLLYACSHAGLVEEGLQLFSLMIEDYAVRPDVKHYTCMVDLLGRAGRLDEALKLIENMTVKKDEGLWVLC